MRLGDEAGAAGFSLVTLETVDSTNRLALDLAQQTGANKTWVLSDKQRAGRGRHGREWASPSGNLYASLLLVSPCAVEDAPKLGFVAGVALAEVVRGLSPPGDLRLKWPNDLLIDGAKLSGLLLEGRALADGKQAVAIGLGLNIAIAPDLESTRTAALAGLGVTVGRREIFRRLSNSMAQWLTLFAQGKGFYRVRDAWREASFPPGTPLTVKLPGGMRSGRFGGIDDRGRLMLDTQDGLLHVDAGDVFLSESRGA